jgi:predicted nucleotidyltransferase
MKPLTKNRAELLRLFLTNPERSFYMQEIGRILGKKPGVFQRTLNNLVSEGIVESEHKANARYFKANKYYPLYKEMKSIVFKTIGVEASLKAELKQISGIQFAFIYGSYAKGKENYLSDIDLVIIGKPDEDELIKKLDRLEEKLQREINYKFYKLKEFTKEIKEKEPFVLEILKEKKIILIGGDDALRKISKR